MFPTSWGQTTTATCVRQKTCAKVAILVANAIAPTANQSPANTGQIPKIHPSNNTPALTSKKLKRVLFFLLIHFEYKLSLPLSRPFGHLRCPVGVRHGVGPLPEREREKFFNSKSSRRGAAICEEWNGEVNLPLAFGRTRVRKTLVRSSCDSLQKPW